MHTDQSPNENHKNIFHFFYQIKTIVRLLLRRVPSQHNAYGSGNEEKPLTHPVVFRSVRDFTSSKLSQH